MNTIYKYGISPDCEIRMPEGAKILTVQTQYGDPQIWAQVDPGQPTEIRRFRTFGTGHDFDPTGLVYIGTFQLHEGSLIFHLFEDIR